MNKGLKSGIRGLELSYLFNNEVEDLSQRIDTKIHGPLSYSCQYWAAHL
jgi:hypothetical protein